jgi:hypothetical protein
MEGDCIVKACQQVLANPLFTFCYAKVAGQGPLLGQRILHAWNELGDVVFDFSNGHSFVMRKEKYYEIAQIEEKDVTKQTAEETIKLMLETDTYGGWINAK